MKCANCNATLKPGKSFCIRCGKAAPQAQPSTANSAAARVCPKCGSDQKPGKRFCHSCGWDSKMSPSRTPLGPSPVNIYNRQAPLPASKNLTPPAAGFPRRHLVWGLGIIGVLLMLGLGAWRLWSGTAGPGDPTTPQQKVTDFLIAFQNNDARAMAGHLLVQQTVSEDSIVRVGRLMSGGDLILKDYDLGSVGSEDKDVVAQVSGRLKIGEKTQSFTDYVLLRRVSEGWRIVPPDSNKIDWAQGSVLMALAALVDARSLVRLEQLAEMKSPLDTLPRPSSDEELIAIAEKAVVFIRAARNGGSSFGEGSGFFVADNGTIVTNHHVVGGASAIEVITNDGRSQAAQVLYADAQKDLAVLKVEIGQTPALSLGDSDQARKGARVIAIGFPLGSQLSPDGIDPSVSIGIISAIRKRPDGRMLQTTAAVYHGNSGGPLIDTASGTVIGVVTAIAVVREANTREREAEQIAFAVPVNEVKPFLGGQVWR